MTKFAIFVELKAKPGLETKLANFLAGAQPLAAAERGTVAWFAVRFDHQTFAIFGEGNNGRGDVAAILIRDHFRGVSFHECYY